MNQFKTHVTSQELLNYCTIAFTNIIFFVCYNTHTDVTVMLGDIRVNMQQPSSRIEVHPDGSLTLKSAQRNDQGEYTCLVSNEHGKDLITYHLLVQGNSS